MKTLTEHLTQYAHYHRDQRNILTHYVGIPMIVIAVLSLTSVRLAEFSLPIIGSVWLSPALLIWVLSSLFYLKLDGRLGVVMLVLTGGCLWLAQQLAMQSTADWLMSAIGIFVVGWIFQFIGHYFEGRKPAFVDDLTGLVIGPLFVVTEVGFMLGLRTSLQADIEKNAGPVR